MSKPIPAAVLRTWRILTWRHWAWATAIAVLVALSMPLQEYFTNRYWAFWRVLFHTPWYLLISYLFLIAIAAAEASDPGAVRTSAWRYVAAISVATVLCYATIYAFPELVRSAPREVVAGQTLSKADYSHSKVLQKTPRVFVMMGFTGVMIEAWLAALIYVRLRNSRRATRALADAELDRSEAQRNLLAAQLVAAHAQIDPSFVLQTLDRVERAYESDPGRADLLLDEFIAFLRDAIPRLRSGDSPEPELESQGSPG